MQFDLVDLRLFGAIVEAGSITRGAERSGLALAAASARVKAMEEMLGTTLLERGRRGVRATAAGEALARHAQLVLAQIEHMRGELRDHARGGIRGRVRLWSNTSALEEDLPEKLSPWLSANPGIDIEFEERQSNDVAMALRQGRADIGVLSDWAGSEGLDLHEFRDDRLMLVTASTHALARRRKVQFADLLQEEFVGLSAESALAQHIDAHALRAGHALRYRARLRGFDGICRMVERGVGIAILPETSLKRRRASMKIAIVPLADAWGARRLVVAVRKATPLPAHAQRLLDHLLGTAVRKS